MGTVRGRLDSRGETGESKEGEGKIWKEKVRGNLGGESEGR